MNSDSQFSFSSKDLGLLGNVLNEVLNGFDIPEFHRRIGMKKAELDDLFKHLLALGDRDSVLLNISQTRALRNALFETIRELGAEEFHTRTGYDFGQGNASLKRLDQLLGTDETQRG
jgi:hypothetical protein